MAALSQWAELLEGVAWPIVAVVALLFLGFSRQLHRFLGRITRRATRVSVFGVELELTKEAAAEFRGVTQEGFEQYRRLIKTEFDREVNARLLGHRVRDVAESHIIPLLKSLTPGFRPSLRCTIFVPDVLFSEGLYQLIDYYPRKKGGGAGRVWSVRFGIIGRAWRSGQSSVEGSVPKDPQKLIDQWGMTMEEATDAGEGRQSFAAIILRDPEDAAVGLFYMDAKEKDVFGRDEDGRKFVAETVERACQKTGTTRLVAEVFSKLAERAPAIQIYQR